MLFFERLSRQWFQCKAGFCNDKSAFPEPCSLCMSVSDELDADADGQLAQSMKPAAISARFVPLCLASR